jgi:ParB/RepB/Spo0J family partition protein
VRGHDAPATGETPYCREHLEYFASMKDGALARRIDRSLDYPDSDLPIDSVHPGSFVMRPDMSAESVRDLAKSLEEMGQLAPILVVPDRGRYEIVFGHRRWMAAKLIPGKETIWAQVAPSSTPRTRLLTLACAENFQRQWVPPFGRSAWIAKLRDQEKMTNGEIAAAMNLSEREVQRHFRALRATNDDVLGSYLKGEVSLRTALRLSYVRPDRQTEVLREIVDGRMDRTTAERAAAAAARQELKAAFRNWRANPGEDVKITGGSRGPQTVCISFEGTEQLFEFYAEYVHPRRRWGSRAQMTED